MTTTPYLASEAGMALGTLAKKNKKNAGYAGCSMSRLRRDLGIRERRSTIWEVSAFRRFAAPWII